MLKNNLITKYFSENSRANIKEVDNLSKLTKGNGLVIVDKEVYDYYKNSKFSKYEVLYTDYVNNDFSFMIYKGNEEFYNLFNYIITTNSYYNYRLSGLNSLSLSLVERTSFQELYLIVLGVALLPILVIIAFLIFFKRKKTITEVRKEDRRKYTDILTSLKNRNYLNLNMKLWEDSQVYPQAVLIVDLNNVQYVNDNYGHAVGDKVLRKIASIVMSHIRSTDSFVRYGGDEFVIVFRGIPYEVFERKLQQIKEHVHQAYFEEAPDYEFSISIGGAYGKGCVEDMVNFADKLMYEAKRTKNSVKIDKMYE